jgi:hypothetical protein
LGAIRAVRTGQEALTRDLLDDIRLDYTSERRHARLVNAKAKAKRGRRDTPMVGGARNEVPPAMSDPHPAGTSAGLVANQ